jgi:SAM-dependent methyltransferase
MAHDRTRSRALHAEFAQRGDVLGWFDALYREAAGDPARVPWADLAQNPYLADWHRRTPIHIHGRLCLVVGCGLGDDAEYLASAGGKVTAFDLSDTAVRWCHRRFPASPVSYLNADLLAPPKEWMRRFEFIFEANTLQSLPAELRREGMERIAGFLAPNGHLLVVCRGRECDEVAEGPPWPLARTELDVFTRFGLVETSFADVIDERDDARRFVVEYVRRA